MSEVYLIDANSLITPSREYYQFKFNSPFWDRIKENIVCGKVVILDLVEEEIKRGKDELADWLDNIVNKTIIDRRNKEILNNYIKVLEYIKDSDCYKSSALSEWSEGHTADPWIVATAITKGFKIVTFERRNGNLNRSYPSGKASIPDIADKYDVQVCDLFQMMEELGLALN